VPRFLDAFKSRRIAFMAPLGFASGLPYLLTGSTLTAWMAVEGVDLSTIGHFAYVTLPYSLKFLWAPLLDRYALPFLGRRRGWMFAMQLALLFAIALMGFTDPVTSPGRLAALALAVSFLSASNDVVSDAYRTDVLPAHERASGTAVFVAGYRVALIVSGAGALMLTRDMFWWGIYLVMAATMSVGLIATALTPAPIDEPPAPETLSRAIVLPFLEFFRRPQSIAFLAIIAGYKIGDTVANQMLIPFLVECGYELLEIGAVAKGFGLAATIVGALLGGGLVARFGLKPCLLAFGLLQATTNVLYIALDQLEQHSGLLVAAIGVDNLFNGLGTAAFVAFLMSLCDRRYSAFQYALLSSVSSIAGRMLAGESGTLAETVGWSWFFGMTALLALPALAILAAVRVKD